MSTIVPTKNVFLTLDLDDESQAFFNHLRNEHYPAFANKTQAHITLIYCLKNYSKHIREKLIQSLPSTAIQLNITQAVHQCNTVYFEIVSPQLVQLHTNIQEGFKQWLGAKDLQSYNPHITIQHRVTVYKAMNTAKRINESWNSKTIWVNGISCWYVEKAHWNLIESFAF